jgi:hypothetical protein
MGGLLAAQPKERLTMPRRFNAHPKHPAVAYLIRLHADVNGQLRKHNEQGRKLRADLRAVETVIRLYDPKYDVRTIPARPRNRVNMWYRRGTMFRVALDILRAADKPLTTREMAKKLFARKGITEPSAENLRDLAAGLRVCLHRKNGKIVKTVGEGFPLRWVLNRDV